VLAIAAPSLRGFVHGRRTAETAGRILSLTQLARSRAASNGDVYRLIYDESAGAYWVDRQRAGAFVALADDFGRRRILPQGIDLEFESVSEPDSAPYVLFYPDGRCGLADIHVIGSRGDVLRVLCESPTEGFSIVSGTRNIDP
jgi:Tfp pilus assembly protein FimT